MALSFLAINAVTAQQPSDANRQLSASVEMQAFLGTWEVDPSRTKVGAITTSYEQEGDNIRATTP